MQTTNYSERIISQVISVWTSRNKAFNDFFDKYDNEAYLNEIAPDRNRAVYLLGHLIAVNDNMIPLFGLGEKLYPELEAFSGNADRSFAITDSVAQLKEKWNTLNKTLTNAFSKMTPEDWMSRHSSVSQEDFEKEPTRNKLNVLLSRTNHQSYHLGQLNLMGVQETVL